MRDIRCRKMGVQLRDETRGIVWVPRTGDRGAPDVRHGADGTSPSYIHHVSTPLTIADVERIATLAHLELTPEEKQTFTKQLADILTYAEQLQAIDTTGVVATAHVNAHEAERDDQLRPCLAVEDALRNAPDGAPDAGLFRVPRVIG